MTDKPRIADDFDMIRRAQQELFGQPEEAIPKSLPRSPINHQPVLHAKTACFCGTKLSEGRKFCLGKDLARGHYYCTGLLPKEDGE